MINLYRDQDIKKFLRKFTLRRGEVSKEVDAAVTAILQEVRSKGDTALYKFSNKFDGVDLQKHGIQVTAREIKKAYQSSNKKLLDVLAQAHKNIKSFHEKSLPQSWVTWENDGVMLGQRVMPLERVGVYVPGGRAAYPSSLLMGVIPAQVAGVKEIAIVTPCDKKGGVNQTILAAAFKLGIDKVYRVGGAHAIAALAYGTETIPQVDKIVGPGNIYVATAKKQLYGQVGIDMVAGPSEVAIIADESANAAFIAADLFAQAEHDPLASAILITTSLTLVKQVQNECIKQLRFLTRKAIIEKSLDQYGGIILLDTLEQCAKFSDSIAPEHLGLHVQDPWALLTHIRHAGAIFLGSYSPEAVGDYWAGPNHVLPTSGSARFFSPLRTEDFLKISSIVAYTDKAIKKNGKQIVQFAQSEGLDAHAKAIEMRIK